MSSCEDEIDEQQKAELRERARRLLLTETPVDESFLGAETPRLLEEIRICQAELELQNQDLHEAQAALTRSRDEYFHLYDFAPVGYMTLDSEGVIKRANLTAAEILGKPRGQLIGKVFLVFIVPAHRDAFFRHRQTVTESTARQTCELQLVSGDEANRWFRIESVSMPDENGGEAHCLSALTDITETKLREDAMIRSERLAAVGTLAAGVAHEFNNLNGGILGYADLLLNEPDLPQSAIARVEKIIQAAIRARDITRSLLAFARPSQTLEAMWSLDTIVRETVDMLEREIRQHGIESDLDLQPHPESLMHGNGIGQVLANLIINAIHAMAGRSTRRLTIRTGQQDGMIFLCVADTGCGIPSRNRRNIFSPFFSTKGEKSSDSSSPLAHIRGVGLGLSVCETIANRHGGRIEVESAENSGSTFTLYLPIRTNQDPQQKVIRVQMKEIPPGRILILDDEEMIVEILSDMLSDAGHTVAHCHSGLDALQRLGRETFDVVLVDLRMPQMSGEEFIQLLQNLPAERRPVPIIVTGRGEALCENDPVMQTAFDVITKPFKSAELLPRVRGALAERRGRDAPRPGR